MKTKPILFPLAVAAMLILTSCPETTVPRDFGTRPLKLKSADWDGVWSEPGDAEGMTFTVTDAAKGMITITFPEKENKEKDVLKVVVNEVNGGDKEKDLAFFIHFDKDSEAFGPFNLIRRPEKGLLHLWNPKDDVIEAAVKSGELKGELTTVPKTKDEAEHHHARLAADRANYGKLLDPKFWEWTEPGVFVKRAAK